MKPENEMSTRRIVIVAPIQMHAYFHTNVPSGGRRAHSTACCAVAASTLGAQFWIHLMTHIRSWNIFSCAAVHSLCCFLHGGRNWLNYWEYRDWQLVLAFFIYLYHIQFQRMSRKLCENQIIVHLTMTWKSYNLFDYLVNSAQQKQQ